MESFKFFLEKTKLLSRHYLRVGAPKPPRKLQIILGNTSCDLDSCIGSLITAYLISFNEILKMKSEEISEKQLLLEPDRLSIPLLNTKSLTGKAEILEHLSNYSIALTSLSYFAPVSDLGVKNMEITLFDHALLDPSQSELLPSVRRIIDHHELIQTPSSVEYHHSYCGSCISLAINLYYRKQAFCELLNQFASAPLLIDTVFFNPDIKRFNHLDLEAYELLSLTHENAKQIYKFLKKKRDNVEANLKLGIKGLFQKDYKCYEVIGQNKINFGCSSIPVNFKNQINEFGLENYISSVLSFAQENSLPVYIILNKQEKVAKSSEEVEESKGEFVKSKILLFYFENEEILRQFHEIFMSDFEEELGLSSKSITSNPNIQLYYFRNLLYTRKKLEPIWKIILKKII